VSTNPAAPKTRDALRFIDVVRGKCAAAGILFRLEAREKTREGDLGWFDSDKKRLLGCVNRADWLTVLAHEVGHLEQFVEGDPVLQPDAPDFVGDFEAWCQGKKKLKALRLRQTVRTIQRNELDAERRAVGMIRSFHLTEKIDTYIREANLYVWKYEVSRRVGHWPNYGDAVSHVVEEMPSRLMAVSQIGKPPAMLEANAQP